ncbi:hypothetical protein PHLCEN_2v4386 [Hermanssonia centrifuga]|uniref:Uncharacterized protein n=1 Tax=Hermanssonia centrifuga TaxID=98765 RepID=A0A2R6PVA0_9APHY|nr:hypothetical protein PHLCEN_2v4386 [Hermanssonia centrifuga]
MFGEGKISDFEELLDMKLSPFLSSVAYQFWRANASAFHSGFHMQGYSGHALRLAKWAFLLGGVRKWVRRFVDAESLEEQGRIWDHHLRPVLLAPWITKLFFANPVFLWNALGVPGAACQLDAEIAQMHRVLSKGGAVYWRSAAKRPWYDHLHCLITRGSLNVDYLGRYIAHFSSSSFVVEALAIRQTGQGPIDRVNMVRHHSNIVYYRTEYSSYPFDSTQASIVLRRFDDGFA